MTPATLVRLQAVGVRLGPAPILRSVEMALHSGEVLGLVGPNGSGKTTLLRVVATLVRPSEGSGRVLGADLHSAERWSVRHRISLLAHAPALYPELTLQENTALVASLLGRPPNRVGEVLEAVGLGRAAGRLAERCSFGMLRRAEFARLLLVQPDLLLLDEPHAGLDPPAAGLVESLVEAVRRRGGATVVVSHDPGRLLPLVDRVVELSEGRLRDHLVSLQSQPEPNGPAPQLGEGDPHPHPPPQAGEGDPHPHPPPQAGEGEERTRQGALR